MFDKIPEKVSSYKLHTIHNKQGGIKPLQVPEPLHQFK